MRKSNSASGLSTSSSSGYTFGGGMSTVQQKRHNSANRIVRFRKDNPHPAGSMMSLMRFKERGKEQQAVLSLMKSNIRARKASGKNLSQKNAWLEEHNYLTTQRRDLERDLIQLVNKYPTDLEEVGESLTRVVAREEFENQQDIHSAMEFLAAEEKVATDELQEISSAITSSDGRVRLQTVASIEQSLPERIQEAVDAALASNVDVSLVDLFRQRLDHNLDQLKVRLTQQDDYLDDRMGMPPPSMSTISSRPTTGCSDTTTTTTPTPLTRCPTATTTVSVSNLSMCSDMQRLAKVINSERVFGRRTREELTDKIQLEFPEWDHKTAQQQLWRYELRMFVKTRKRTLMEEFETNTSNMLAALTAAVRQRSELIESEARAAALAEEREREQSARREHLSKLRHDKRERDAADLERQLAESAAAAAAQAELNKKRETEFNNRLRKLADFRQQKAAAEEQAARDRETAAAEELRKHQLQAQENKVRVEYREQELSKRLGEVRAAKAQAEHEKQMRAAVLNAIAASVAPLVERDANRVVKATCSSSSVTDPQLINEAFANQTRQPGFTNEQIVQDTRFQLTEALGQAGLLNTDYARQIIFNAAPKGPGVAGLSTHHSNPLHVTHAPPTDTRDMAR